MKKITAIMMSVVLIFSAASFGGAAGNSDIVVYIDGEPIAMDQPPVILNDRVMVPMRAIFEAMGVDLIDVSSNDKCTEVIAKCGSSIIVSFRTDRQEMRTFDGFVPAGEDSVSMNYVNKALDATPFILNDRLMIPLRATAEVFSSDVAWDPVRRRVDITTPYPRNKDKTGEITSGELIFNPKSFSVSSDSFDETEFDEIKYDIDLYIEGDELVFSGTAENLGYLCLWINILNEIDIPDSKGDSFEVRWPLKELRQYELMRDDVYPEPAYLIDAQAYVMGRDHSYHTKSISAAVKKNGTEYSFIKPLNWEPVFWERNKRINSMWINPVGFLIHDIDPELVELSNEICKGAVDDYDKLLKIHDWVCENIHYDYDDIQGISEPIGMNAIDVYRYRRGVCGGYADLTCILVQAQNIPCQLVTGMVIRNTASHVWNRAYVNNRWVNIDTTFDSSSTYKDGEYHTSKDVSHKYFDITDWSFANDHSAFSYDLYP